MLKAIVKLGMVAGCIILLTACTANSRGARVEGALPATAATDLSEMDTTRAPDMSTALVTRLVNQTGVSEKQAAGGAGSLFSLAKQRLSPAEFGKVAEVVPEMDSLLAAVPRGTGPGSGMVGDLAGMAGVASNFQALGLSQDMVNRFIPVMLNYVQQQGGTSVMNLLRGALL